MPIFDLTVVSVVGTGRDLSGNGNDDKNRTGRDLSLHGPSERCNLNEQTAAFSLGLIKKKNSRGQELRRIISLK